MKFYGFRFFTQSEQILDNWLLGRDLCYVDENQEEEEDYVLEFAMDMEADLEELRREREGIPVRSKKKIEQYHKAVKLAFEFACEFAYDIVASDDLEDFSMIVFHRDTIFLTGAERTGAEMLSELLRSADEIYVTPQFIDEDHGRLNIQLVYDLCDVVERE